MALLILQPVSVRETRLDRGRATAATIVTKVLGEIKVARQSANLSQDALARQLGWPQSGYSNFERNAKPVTLEDVCTVTSVLGLRPKLELFRIDEGVRDAGQQRLIGRFIELLTSAWIVLMEAPFPSLGDLRSWDVFLRLGAAYRLGVEAETRIRDQQELVRRIRQRELHGGADHILLILSDSKHNRPLVADLRAALGVQYATPSAELIQALREGRPLPGSGLILL